MNLRHYAYIASFLLMVNSAAASETSWNQDGWEIYANDNYCRISLQHFPEYQRNAPPWEILTISFVIFAQSEGFPDELRDEEYKPQQPLLLLHFFDYKSGELGRERPSREIVTATINDVALAKINLDKSIYFVPSPADLFGAVKAFLNDAQIMIEAGGEDGELYKIAVAKQNFKHAWSMLGACSDSHAHNK